MLDLENRDDDEIREWLRKRQELKRTVDSETVEPFEKKESIGFKLRSKLFSKTPPPKLERVVDEEIETEIEIEDKLEIDDSKVVPIESAVEKKVFTEKAKKKILSDSVLTIIQEDLIARYSKEVIDSLFDVAARETLRKVIISEHRRFVHDDLEVVDYVLSEVIGTGFIERLLKSPDITDIGWNGSFLVIETPNNRFSYTAEELGITDIESYINRVIAKFANASGRAFNDTHPILDSSYNNVRLNAIHKSISPDGVTMSLRVVREHLAVHSGNFDDCFAPLFVLDFMEKIMKTGCNAIISGITGTGKTEIQKLLFSFVNDYEKIITIEDVREMHLKKLYPEKDIYSWITNPSTSIATEVKASLRNNPKWIVVSETRGSEAYEMYQGLLTGHNIVTTLHAESAKKIPRRFVGMCMGSYALDEKLLMADILGAFDFGFHIKKVYYKGQILRYLDEIVEFGVEQNTVLFKQVFRHGQFYITTGEQLSSGFLDRMAEKSLAPFYFSKYTDELVEKKVLREIEETEDIAYQNLLKQQQINKMLGGD